MSDYTSAELAAMSVLCMYKASARAEHFAYVGLGVYSAENPLIASLIGRGLVKVTKAGAITPDNTAMRAIMREHVAPEEYRGKLENTSLHFKSRYAE